MSGDGGLVYLDQSTLSDIFKAAAAPDDPQLSVFRPLRPWLNHVASSGRLCLSLAHLHECSRWKGEVASALERWLDLQPLRWVKSPQLLLEQEVEAAVLEHAGLPGRGRERTTDSLMLGIGAGSVTATMPLFHSARTPSRAIDALRQAPSEARELRHWMPATIRSLRNDHARSDWRGVTKSARRDRLGRKQRVRIRDLVREAAGTIRAQVLAQDHDAVDLLSKTDEELDAIAEAAATAWLLREDTLRMLRAQIDYFAGLSERAGPSGGRGIDPDSQHSKKRFGSATWDLFHAMLGGTTCATFTCDRNTAAILGEDFRRSFGLPPALALQKGDAEQFVSRLLAA